MQQTIYRHHKGSYYRIIDHFRIQLNDEQLDGYDEQLDGYIYVDADKFNSVYAIKYVRPISEFHTKLSSVLDEQELHAIQDSEALLDKILQCQLFDILGKYKLF